MWAGLSEISELQLCLGNTNESCMFMSKSLNLHALVFLLYGMVVSKDSTCHVLVSALLRTFDILLMV